MFFRLEQLVHLGDELIGELLHLVLGAMLVVLCQMLVLDESLEMLIRVPPDITDSHPGVFRFMAHDLGHLLAPFLGERRQRYADDVPGADRIEPEIGVEYRFLHIGDDLLLPGCHRQGAGVGYHDAGHLVDGHL